MKIAIISDLHGNYEALRALPETYDELWVLGDLVNYGPEPGAVVDFVRANSRSSCAGITIIPLDTTWIRVAGLATKRWPISRAGTPLPY